MRKAIAVLRILVVLEIAGRIEELAAWLNRRGERLLDRACKKWPDFPAYARQYITPTPEADRAE